MLKIANTLPINIVYRLQIIKLKNKTELIINLINITNYRWLK